MFFVKEEIFLVPDNWLRVITFCSIFLIQKNLQPLDTRNFSSGNLEEESIVVLDLRSSDFSSVNLGSVQTISFLDSMKENVIAVEPGIHLLPLAQV